MINFGFSAFLRVASMNDRPQKTEIKNRLMGKGQGNGYDFHASLKRLCKKLTMEQATFAQALGQTSAITMISERSSARTGLEKYARWRTHNFAKSSEVDPCLFASPLEKFSIKFVPDFYQNIDGQMTAGHIWNTAAPVLVERQAYFAMFLIRNAYLESDFRPQNLAVLDLQGERLIKLSNAVGFSTAMIDGFVSHIEHVFEVVESEIRIQEIRSPRDQTSFPSV